jgi:hypothetical protein
LDVASLRLSLRAKSWPYGFFVRNLEPVGPILPPSLSTICLSPARAASVKIGLSTFSVHVQCVTIDSTVEI